jgi:serine/threonine-protein kinase
MSTQDARIERLLEELVDSHRTPEQVCADCPELLPEVRTLWRQLRRLDADLSHLFPAPAEARADEGELPQIQGYEVEKILGRGGMGIVFRARHLRLNRPVALKMILAGPYANPEERKRFVQEAEAVASLHHPNIVEVYDAGEIDGRPYFTMELVEGGRLSEKVNGMPQPARESAALVAAIADAVHAANQKGIIHRDLTPGNILLASDGTPKVTDFGLARRLEVNSEVTVTGLPMGTPSYMAPEQARGQKSEIGPATDVYGLGAILYDLLTGRPPFRAETSTATIQQLLSEDAVPPARLNSRVPRDLQTICLKCLNKEPRKRYASARDLAEDLQRFQRGEPIRARPVRGLERAARWVRRRPALAGALAAGVLLASALTVTVVWWHGQRKALQATAVAYAKADLSESERLLDRGDFKASSAVLQRAKDRLREYVPPELRDRLSMAFDNLELVTRLHAIRLERALVTPRALLEAPADLLGVLTVPGTRVPADGHALGAEASSGGHYQEAFREAGIGAPGDDPAEAAARIQASPVRGTLVAALDDWAACATDRDQQAWVLAVVRQADPDPWRDRVRDPATWDDPAALRESADRAPVAGQSPQLLAVLGARLRAKKLDAVRFLERAASAYPGDFWVNVEMGNALRDRSEPGEAIGYYRTALALRPETVSLRYTLGDLYLAHKRWDGAIAEFEQAARLDPENPWCHNRLGFTLAWKGGHDDEAMARFREAIRLDPNLGWSHYFLAVALERKNHLDEALDEYRKAARLVPEKRAQWNREVRKLQLRLGRGAEARVTWKEELAAHPPAHDEWFGYAELSLFLGDEKEYRSARSDLLAQFGAVTDRAVAERVGRACLLLPAPEDELRSAVVLTERAFAGGRAGHEGGYPYFRFTEGLARYRQGRFDDAIRLMNGEAASVMGPSPRLVLAMAQYQKGQKDQAGQTLEAAARSYDWNTAKADNHEAWIAHILRREAESLIQPEPRDHAPSPPANQAPVGSK